MSGKEKMSNDPPSYEDSNLQHGYQTTQDSSQSNPEAPGNSQSYSQPFYQQGYSQYPGGNNQTGNASPGNPQTPGYQGYSNYPPEKQRPNGYDPMSDPNVYKVKPQLVNITQANPEHLNPSYPEFQQREQQRWAQGDVPQHPKHGAPLTKGKTDKNNRFGGSAFPGKGGATYNNAARK